MDSSSTLFRRIGWTPAQIPHNTGRRLAFRRTHKGQRIASGAAQPSSDPRPSLPHDRASGCAAMYLLGRPAGSCQGILHSGLDCWSAPGARRGRGAIRTIHPQAECSGRCGDYQAGQSALRPAGGPRSTAGSRASRDPNDARIAAASAGYYRQPQAVHSTAAPHTAAVPLPQSCRESTFNRQPAGHPHTGSSTTITPALPITRNQETMVPGSTPASRLRRRISTPLGCWLNVYRCYAGSWCR